ncbi:RNA-binding RNA processing protein rpp1 [Balamuthia mandrillaris]
MFVDLNLPYEAVGLSGASAEERRRSIMLAASRMGYGCVAWNTVVVGTINPKEATPPPLVEIHNSSSSTAGSSSSSDAMQLQSDGSPSAGSRGDTALRLKSSFAKTQKATNATVRQYRRLTLITDDSTKPSDLSVHNPILAKYDIIAVQPSSDKLFQQACASLDVDIITLDLTSRLPFKLKMQIASQALARGIFFELSYATALRNPSSRRYFISNALALVRATKGKGLILSSEAYDAMELRSPYDVMNLTSMFGLDLAKGKAAISISPDATILHGETRKTHKGVVSMNPKYFY